MQFYALQNILTGAEKMQRMNLQCVCLVEFSLSSEDNYLFFKIETFEVRLKLKYIDVSNLKMPLNVKI